MPQGGALLVNWVKAGERVSSFIGSWKYPTKQLKGIQTSRAYLRPQQTNSSTKKGGALLSIKFETLYMDRPGCRTMKKKQCTTGVLASIHCPNSILLIDYTEYANIVIELAA